MAYQITLPSQLNDRVVVRMPADCDLPVINGQWERQADGIIIAHYTHAELCEAVSLGLEIQIHKFKHQMQEGEQLIIEAKQKQQDTTQLEQQWVALLEWMTGLLDRQAAILAQG